MFEERRQQKSDEIIHSAILNHLWAMSSRWNIDIWWILATMHRNVFNVVLRCQKIRIA